MGKLLVADRMGVTVLPDDSVVDDPLTRACLLVHRPLAGDRTTIALALVSGRRSGGRSRSASSGTP